ncbi:MAG TPA: efflux RND transporter permease subunit [Candidatus Krumholzibacteria bacterium]|nr:efflux RND transporter permease subunit [Candidatus Krumholzibacteria bacterium]
MTLPEIAIKRHVTTLMIIVSLVVMGSVAVFRLPLAFLPDFEQPLLFIQLPYQNASPAQVERLVVRPVEEALGSVGGLRNMWSHINDQGATIGMDFAWSQNMKVARTEVWEKIDRTRRDLPDDMGDIQVSNNWDAREADMPIIEGRLSSKRDLSESWDLLERRIVKPLERIPGVAGVRLDGVNPREVRINLNVASLEGHGMDVRNVIDLLQSSNFDQSLGKVTDGDSRWSLRTVGTFATVKDIENFPIREDGLRLRDVADVRYEEPPLEYGRHLDGDFAIGVTITQESKANTVEVCDAVDRRIAEMNSDPELEGVNFLTWFSQGKEIKGALRDLLYTGIFGAILAALTLYLFLRRVSTTLVSVACIPFSLIVACGFIWARGGSMNTLALLGLIVAIGMLVDNAVVVIENIFRHQEMGEDTRKATRQGAAEVSVAVTAATLTSVIVFLPLIFNKPSEMNLYLKELGVSVCIVILASLFISQTLIPLATSWFIRSRPRPKARLMLKTEAVYNRLLVFNLRHRWLAPVILLATLGSAYFPFTKVDKNFDTSESELFVQVNYDFSENLSLERKEDFVNLLEAALEPHREELMARSIYSFWSDGWTMTRVYLKEGEANEENIAEVRKRLRAVLPEIAGTKFEVMENNQFWRNDRGKRVALQIVGEDSDILAEIGEEAKRRMEDIPGLIDPFAGGWGGDREGREEIHVEIDRDMASRLGVSPMQPAQVVGLTYRGQRLQRFRTADGEREMRVTLDEEETESVAQLRNLPLWTAEGEKIPLASVASFTQKQGPTDINRDNRLTSLWCGARFEEGTREEYIPLVTAAMNGIQMPYGYSWTFGRWEERRKEKTQEFVTNLLLALLLIFVVMASIFESARQALTLLLSLPFALAGAFWTLYISGTDFDQPAAVGLLLLIGTVVNNGIVMLAHVNHYRGQGMPRHEAMLLGCRERLRPIMMTALTTLVSLVPMIVQKPSLGGVYYYSMALVIMGGLLLSTFLTLILLPTNSTLVEDGTNWVVRMLKRLLVLIRVRKPGEALAD